MACFLVPMALGIVTSIAQKTSQSLAKKLKLWILNTLLWGGVILLALEHIWHGEVTLWPPFLTAMTNPADIPVMLHEMATIGTAMSVAIVCTWASILAVANLASRITIVKPKIVKTGHIEKSANTASQQK
ncbi:MAG: hypothetical protein ACTSSJ_03325 [Candidatus Odinarchaeia archaeon]